MLDQNFCSFLEYEISKILANTGNLMLKGFWCDGVLLPESKKEYSQKFVNNNKKVIMTAFIGKTGQEKYKLILKFGNQALSKYAKDLDISDCMPIVKDSNCFAIDTIKQELTIQLN